MTVDPRRVVFAALAGVMAAGQALALLDALGLRWPSPAVTFAVACMVAPVVGALLWRRAPPGDPGAARRWWMAPLAWGLWAGLYYVVAWGVAPGRASELPRWLEPWLPLVPASVLVYLGVHPLSVLPFVGLRTGDEVRRHFLGQMVILAVSVICWSVWPVVLPRQALPPAAGSLGVWALETMRGSDPPLNCLPSTHCAMAVHAALALRRALPRGSPWALGSAAGICLSTLLTRQHYLLDVIAGAALGYLVARLLPPARS